MADQHLMERLQLLEDKLSIYNLIAGHPVTVDSGDGDFARKMYTEDGEFDRGASLTSWKGRDVIAAATNSPDQIAARESGMIHISSVPYVEFSGDTAVAYNYVQVVVPEAARAATEVPGHGSSPGLHIHRITINKWVFVRTSDGWKVKNRSIRPVGTQAARDLFSRGF